jgi:hypothetical protein
VLHTRLVHRSTKTRHCPSPLLMHGLCMRHQVIRRASLAAIDRTCRGSTSTSGVRNSTCSTVFGGYICKTYDLVLHLQGSTIADRYK